MAILEDLSFPEILFIGTEKNGNYLGIQLFVLHLFVLLMRGHLQELSFVKCMKIKSSKYSSHNLVKAKKKTCQIAASKT